MKKLLFWFCCTLLLVSLFPSQAYAAAAAANSSTLPDWGIRIYSPEDTIAVLEEDEYYIYALEEGTIPYVMVRPYRYDSETEFLEDFTAYMRRVYSDLKITEDIRKVRIGGRTCWEIDYTYKISGYNVTDRRVAITVDELTYMFCSKEVESLGLTTDGLLEQVISDCVFIYGEDALPEDEEENASLANAYLYCLDDGMPKYWLDFTGGLSNNLILHCYFRSSDPEFYESKFILDLGTADISDSSITIRNVYDEYGFDHSNWFKGLTLRLEGDHILMLVRRDESTLAGGEEDNILTGIYDMAPLPAYTVYEYHQDDGMLKYWLEIEDEEILLHAMFRSGDPEYYEEVFSLDLNTASAIDDNTIRIRKVKNSRGIDVSEWFKSLTLMQDEGSITMYVRRDEKTLAGGTEDNILTGTYECQARVLLSANDTPMTGSELAALAQRYYFTRHGFFPPIADYEKNKDGTFTIHLYEIVKMDDFTHTATSAWYTVDKYGVGTNIITEEAVDLKK